MRGFLPVLVGAVGGLGVMASISSADTSCAGNACGVVTLSADGCRWTNKSDRPVRLAFASGGVARMVTVLAPGAAYKEPDKKNCATSEGDGRYDASFATLGAASPEATPPKPQVRAKASVTATPPAAAAAQPVAAEVAVASIEASVPLPRAKPKPPPVYPPRPRAKPEIPVEAAAVAPTVVAPTAAIEPSAPEPSLDACGDDCPPILFKVIDECVWVLNLNPRAVAFEAEAGGKRTALKLEAADGAKADARTAAIAAGTQPKNEAALHMRLKDPFQTAGSGIPVFRARLGPAGACVKSRAEITRFQASYVK